MKMKSDAETLYSDKIKPSRQIDAVVKDTTPEGRTRANGAQAFEEEKKQEKVQRKLERCAERDRQKAASASYPSPDCSVVGSPDSSFDDGNGDGESSSSELVCKRKLSTSSGSTEAGCDLVEGCDMRPTKRSRYVRMR
jgi:hypothetical protein